MSKKAVCRKCYWLSFGKCALGIAGAPKLRFCQDFLNKHSKEAKELENGVTSLISTPDVVPKIEQVVDDVKRKKDEVFLYKIY